MVIKYYYTLLMCLFLVSNTAAETKHAKIWASVQFNKKSVMVGEPLVVTITVYTSTWFSNPPEFGEIQVPKAIMARLQQRTGSMMKTIGKKKYPAIEQKFVVYPIQVGENSLPSIDIMTECPPEGDYKAKKRTIRSPERSFTVLAPPDNIETNNWLTAYNVRLTENWDRPLDNLKTGDVLERRITITASGALASLIPPLEFSEIEFGSIYPHTPSLSNIQNKGSFSGKRIEIGTYLVEKAGTFTIPELSFSFFNPRSKKIESKILTAKELTIEENPNLEFLLSMQDSLQALLAAEEPAEAAKPFEFLGLNWWQLLVVIFTGLIVLYLIFHGMRKLASQYEKRKKEEAESEAHYFELLRKAVQSNEGAEFMRQLMFWYDRFRDPKYDPDFNDFVGQSQNEKFSHALNALEKALFSTNAQIDEHTIKRLYQYIKIARHESFQKNKIEQITLQKLNP